jgi:DNA-binding IscR family transcriptional regulator
VLQEVWVELSEETSKVLDRFTLADLVSRTRVGHSA